MAEDPNALGLKSPTLQYRASLSIPSEDTAAVTKDISLDTIEWWRIPLENVLRCVEINACMRSVSSHGCHNLAGAEVERLVVVLHHVGSEREQQAAQKQGT